MPHPASSTSRPPSEDKSTPESSRRNSSGPMAPVVEMRPLVAKARLRAPGGFVVGDVDESRDAAADRRLSPQPVQATNRSTVRGQAGRDGDPQADTAPGRSDRARIRKPAGRRRSRFRRRSRAHATSANICHSRSVRSSGPPGTGARGPHGRRVDAEILQIGARAGQRSCARAAGPETSRLAERRIPSSDVDQRPRHPLVEQSAQEPLVRRAVHRSGKPSANSATR